MHMKPKMVVLAGFLAALAGPLGASDVPPWELNMDRVEFIKKGNLEDSKVYAIPTLYLHISARIKTEAKNEGAQVKAKIYVEGLTKTLVQGLAKQIYDDLVAKIRAAGFTVLSYDDLKVDLAGLDRMEANKKYGMPTKMFDGASGIDYMIVAPSDEQAIDYNFATGPIRPYTGIAKGKEAIVLVPQIYFDLPQTGSEAGGGAFRKTIKLNITPQMALANAHVHGLPPDLGWTGIRIQRHGKRYAAEVAGSVEKLGQDQNDFGEWSRTTADFAFVVDPAAFSSGVLSVGYAINTLTADTIKKEHD